MDLAEAMNQEKGEKLIIRHYLLGMLNDEAVREDIEKRIISDDGHYDEVTVVESELIEEYLDGELSASESENFKKYFLADPARRRELNLIRNLRSIKYEPQAGAAEGRVGFWDYFRRGPLLKGAAAFLILFVAAAALWIAFRPNTDLDNGIASLRSAYRSRRPVEPRLTVFPEYAPYSETRGNGDKAADPAALDRAARYLNNASSDPADAEAHHAYGLYFLSLRDLERARRELDLAVSLAPNDSRTQSDAASVYLESAKEAALRDDQAGAVEALNKSLGHYDRAIALDPRLPEPYFGRALSLEALENFEQAKAAWKKYLEIDNSSRWAEEVRRRLDELGQNGLNERSASELEADFYAAYRAGDRDRAGRLLLENRELIRGKYIPGRLASSVANASSEARPEVLEALQFAAEVSLTKTGDPFAAEIARFYSSASEQQLAAMRTAHESMDAGIKQSLSRSYDKALPHFADAVAGFRNAGNSWESKIAEYLHAYTLINLDRVPEALEQLLDIDRFAGEKGYSWLQLTSLYWVGGSYVKLREPAKALHAFEAALELSERVGDGYAIQRNNLELSTRHAYAGQFRTSITYLRRALSESAKSRTSLRQRYRTLGEAFTVLYDAGFLDAAVPAALEAAAVADRLEDTAWRSQSRAWAGLGYARRGDLLNARAMMDESLALAGSAASEADRTRMTAFSKLKLGDLERYAGNYDAAEKYYFDAANYYDTVNMPRTREEAHQGLLFSYLAQGKTAELERQIPLNIEIAEEYRSRIAEESQRASYLGIRSNIYDVATAFEFDRGNHAAAFEYAEMSNARALLDWMSKGTLRPGDAVDSGLTTGTAPQSLNSLQRQMPANVQLVQFLLLDRRLLVWVLTRDSLAVKQIEVSAVDLENKIDRFRALIADRADGESVEFAALSRELYDLTIGQVRPMLDPAREICIVPNRALYKLPFAALRSPGGEPLIAEMTLLFAPSANVFLRSTQSALKRAAQSEESILAVGNPRFEREQHSGKADLPDAAAEAASVAEYYQIAVTLLGAKASKNAFLNSMSSADVVHFAGHYVVVPELPTQSYLLMSGSGEDDGKLTNRELAELKLPLTRLVVLAACRTGAEEFNVSEGMIGLSRTMLAIDVPLVVGTQWDVDSASSSRLMKRFHQLRKSGGLTTTAALRQAQLEMLNDRSQQYSSPYYWAAYAPFGGHASF